MGEVNACQSISACCPPPQLLQDLIVFSDIRYIFRTNNMTEKEHMFTTVICQAKRGQEQHTNIK